MLRYKIEIFRRLGGVVLLAAMLFHIASSTLFVHEHIIDGKYVYHSHLYSGLPAAHCHTSTQLDILNRSAQPDIEFTACVTLPTEAVQPYNVEYNTANTLIEELYAQSSLSPRAPPVVARA